MVFVLQIYNNFTGNNLFGVFFEILNQRYFTYKCLFFGKTCWILLFKSDQIVQKKKKQTNKREKKKTKTKQTKTTRHQQKGNKQNKPKMHVSSTSTFR